MTMPLDFEIFIIKTLSDEYIENCKNTLLDTSGKYLKNNLIHTLNEKGTREETLNDILNRRNKNKDLFIVADDIVFLQGWYEKLTENYSNGDIIGFSMIDAKSGLLQDFGYDFVLIDGDLTYRGLYKHKKVEELDLPAYRQCDAITGCAMYIKNLVFDDVNHFPIEGANRWGELLFSYSASKFGHNTIVLNAHLKHHAISTKQKADVKKSSISWLIEKALWRKVVKKYLTDVNPTEKTNTVVSDELIKLINKPEKCLIYGAGTVAYSILISAENIQNIDICSGLPEEVGLLLVKKNILDVNRIDISKYNNIIISAIGYEKQIVTNYFYGQINKIIQLKKENNIINILDK